jgi:hypothetical protein
MIGFSLGLFIRSARYFLENGAATPHPTYFILGF